MREARSELARLSRARVRGLRAPQFTCFTGSKVQILTPPEALQMREEELARLSRALAEAESALAGTWFFFLQILTG